MGYSQPSLRDWFILADSTQDCVLGYSQPSLRDWFVLTDSTQDCVLGYSQPPLRGSEARPYLDATKGRISKSHKLTG